MRVSQVRTILWSLSVLAVVTAIAAIAAAVLLPLDLPPAGLQSASRGAATLPATRSTSSHALSWFEPAWRRRLRRPLVDPPPPVRIAKTARTAKSVKPAALPVRLIGTIVGGAQPRGIFMSGLAKIELKGVGEMAGGAKVLAIDTNSATLSYNGLPVTIQRERAPFDSSGASYDTAVRSPTDSDADVEGGS